MIRYALLDDPLLSVTDRGGQRTERHTLPELYAALTRGDVGDFPALRPHQRHVWHAFLVQVAALALHRASLAELPDDAVTWRGLLLSLTPDDSDGAAWALATPHERPALLQPAVPQGDVSSFKRIETPDALDMLVTAKNHDLKQHIMRAARPEHWLYALVSLQTQEGFLGAGNYGVSRMNGGFANRPGIGVAPQGGPGARVRRDVRRLLTNRARLLEDYPFYPSEGGVGLLWLVPWDGHIPLSPSALDPFYVEICRRVRIVAGTNGSLEALGRGSKVGRIDADQLNGRTGDAWTPLIAEGAERKALTVNGTGFSYKRVAPLLFPNTQDVQAPIRAPLQVVVADDDTAGLTIILRALVRGRGKTEGFHERRVPVSRVTRRFLLDTPSEAGAAVASERVGDAGTFARKVLYPAALATYTAAPSAQERKRDDDTAKARAGAAVAMFDHRVDSSFFADLDAELERLGDVDAQAQIRAEWLLLLRDHGQVILSQLARSAPTAAMRHYRTQVRTQDAFDRAFRRYFGARVPETLARGIPPVSPPPISGTTETA